MAGILRAPSRIAIVDAAAIVSLAVVAWGLLRTDFLSPIGWTAVTIRSLVMVVGGSVLAVAAAFALERRRGRSGAPLLGLALAALAAAAFGPSAALSVACLMLVALVVGTAILRPLEGGGRAFFQRIAVGLGVVTIAVALASPFRLNLAALQLAILFGAAPLLALPGVRAALAGDWRAAASAPPVASGWSILWTLFSAFVAAFFLLHAALPERYHDALATHLFVASNMAAKGFWSFDPELYVFAVVPMAADFLYAHLFALAGEPAVKLFNYAAFLVTAGLIRGAVAGRFGAQAGAIAALLFAAMPLTLVETASAFIENPLTMWITAAAAILFERGRALDWRAVAGVLIALAAASATKLHGVVASALLGALMLFQFASGRPGPARWAGFAAMAAVAAAIGAAAYAFAWWKTGNPVFPFFNDIFRSPYYDPVRFSDLRWVGRFKLDMLYQASFASGGFMETYNGALGLSLAACLGVGLAALAVQGAGLYGLALVMAGFIAVIGASTQYLRYFYPVLPIAFMLVGLAVALYLRRGLAGVLCRVVVAGVLCVNVYKLNAAGWILTAYDFPVIFDREQARRYEQAFAPEKTLIRIVNELAGTRARVVLSGISTAAPLQGEAIFTSWYNLAFRRAGHRATTREDVDAFLKATAPTHIIHRPPADKSNPLPLAIDRHIAEVARPLVTVSGATLYEVLPRQ